MNNKRMELLRNTLNEMIVSEHTDKAELLKKSQELDKLILLAIRENNFINTVLGDKLMKEFEIVVDKLQLFEKMYDTMRIIDPVSKRVLDVKGHKLCETDTACYMYWQHHTICDNCISIRAYNEDDAFFKIEASGDSIYMVTSVPISIQGRKLVVELFKNTANSVFLKEGEQFNEVNMLKSIEHMNQIAVKDELTNLYNRRYINEKLPVDLLNAAIKSEPLSFVFADLDHFKNINNVYGHTAGDQILQEFASELKKHIRAEKDWAARYGDEEFLICLPGTDYDTAKIIADRIRTSIMKKEFIAGESRIHVTCSFRVHTISDDDKCLTIEDIIKAIDTKLYQAKAAGRNKVI